MNKALLLLFTICSTFFISCKKEKADNEYLNDFEAIGHWTDGQNVSRETSSSGLFCTVTDSGIPYTSTMKLNWSDLKVAHPKSAELIAWVLVRDMSAKAKLAFSIETKEGQNILWEGVEVQRSIKEVNKWFEVKLNIDLNKEIPDDALIKVYGVNDGVKRIYWDNFLLRLNE